MKNVKVVSLETLSDQQCLSIDPGRQIAEPSVGDSFAQLRARARGDRQTALNRLGRDQRRLGV